MSEIYQPREDSYLMFETLVSEIPKLLKNNPRLRFLEIGSGSGINLEAAKKAGLKKADILGTDLNKHAVEYCKKLGFNCIESDLFKRVKGDYGIIVFNPPYLPEDEENHEPEGSKITTTGGKKGNEIIIKFLRQAKEHLEDNGKIFLITSSLAEDVDFEELGFQAKPLFMKDLFFEELILWECLKI